MLPGSGRHNASSCSTAGPWTDQARHEPGQIYILHDIALDSKGNLYTADVNKRGNRRAQKFVVTRKPTS